MSNVNVKINGITYNGVPEVSIPKADSTGDATFYATDGDTVASGDVLAGKTYHGAGGSATGTMVNNGDTSGTIATKTGTVTVPAGYTSGGTVGIDSVEQAKIISGNIKAGATVLGVQGKSTVIDTELSADAAAAANISSGKKAFVNGNAITGTLTTPTISQDSSTKVLSIS